MSLLDGLIGNATKIDAVTSQLNLNHVLVPGEQVEHAYEIVRDWIVFTSGRLILIDVQGLTGSKVEYHSIPYRSIYHFCVKTAGMADLHDEMKIWVAGTQDPIQRKFTTGVYIFEVQAVLAAYVLGYSATSLQAKPNKQHPKNRVETTQHLAQKAAAAQESNADDFADVEFCFHCGESLAGTPEICPKCAGSLR